MPYAFLFLGFLVGNLTGLSASPIATVLVPSLFAFLGGSILVFMEKISPADRGIASWSIGSFSLACLLGTYLGILSNIHNWLGTNDINSNHYLRTSEAGEISSIDQRYNNKELNGDEAYKRLKTAIDKAGKNGTAP